ncbi:Rrf2 family transcriptional regulator [Candidatus Beckwithbacteria bacterium]|nr:Rrf2 family transcriptional regulator [Candidatus Beckwithbacteria bacterium]
MLQISKRSQYGIYFLLALAIKKNLISIRQISQELRLPYRFLSQIAADLRNKHIVMSKEGSRGGYSLAKKPSDISLLAVVEALDAPVGLIDCQLEKGCNRAGHCKFRKQWDVVRNDIQNSLDKYNLQDFLD